MGSLLVDARPTVLWDLPPPQLPQMSMATDQCTLPFSTHKLLIFYMCTILYHSVRRLEPKQYALRVIPGICRHCKSSFVCRAHSNELNVPRAGSTELSLPYLRTIRLIGGWPPGNFQIDSGMRHKSLPGMCPTYAPGKHTRSGVKGVRNPPH